MHYIETVLKDLKICTEARTLEHVLFRFAKVTTSWKSRSSYCSSKKTPQFKDNYMSLENKTSIDACLSRLGTNGVEISQCSSMRTPQFKNNDMSSENNTSIGAHVYQVYVLREWRVGVKGGVCPNHLHLCILFYLHPVSMLQLVILSITVQIHHASRPASPVSFSFWCGSVVIFRQVQLSEDTKFNDYIVVQ